MPGIEGEGYGGSVAAFRNKDKPDIERCFHNGRNEKTDM